MLTVAYEIDSLGFVQETIVVDLSKHIPVENIVTESPSVGISFYKMRWNGTSWEEGATQEEIDELSIPNPTAPSLEDLLSEVIERLAATESALFDIILGD